MRGAAPDSSTAPASNGALALSLGREQSKIEGMDAIESRRRVAAMDTVLSKDPLDESEPGYQFCKAEPKEPGA